MSGEELRVTVFGPLALNVLKLKYLRGQNIVKMKNVFEALKSFEEDRFIKKYHYESVIFKQGRKI